MNRMDPLVTIIVPAYKVSAYLAEALDSALAQTYPCIEIIVVDQDRDEAMERIRKSYAKSCEDGKVRWLYQERPNVAAARNLAIRNGQGEIFVQLDGDDCLEPQAVRRLVDLLCSENGADAVFPNALMFGRADVEGVKYQDIYPAYRPVTYSDVVTRRTNIFGAMSYHRHTVESAGFFDETVGYAEDFDLWLRVIRKGYRIDFTTEVLYRYRRRDGAMCDAAEVPRLHSLLNILENQSATALSNEVDNIALSAERERLLAYLQLCLGKELIAKGEYRRALQHLEVANKSKRSSKISLAILGLHLAPRIVARFL